MDTINLDKINELVSLKEFKEAKIALEEILNTKQDNIEALKLLGLCNVNLGLFKEGKSNFETVVKYKNDDATSWFYLANCYDNLEDFLHAKTAYLEVIKLRENYMDAYKNLGVVYIKEKEPEKTVELVKKALTLVQDDYLLYYLVGTAYLSVKDFKNSIPYFEKALELNPSHAQIYNNLGTAYLTMGQYLQAYEKYLIAAELEPTNALTFYNIASILQLQNKHTEACEYFRKAYSLEKTEQFLVSLALSEFKSKQYEEAIKHYKKLASQHPEKHNFKYNLACCYEMTGEYTFAIGILNQLVMMNPKSKLMAQKLAGLYLKTNQPLKAKELYEQIITQGIVSAEIYYEYALICVAVDDLDIAEKILKKVIELNPKMATARKDLGVIYLNKRLFDYAKDEFETAYELRPDSLDIIFEYANFLHATSDFKKAKGLYFQAYEKDPTNPEKSIFYALNAISLNELDEALKYAQIALKLSPNNDFVLYLLGQINYNFKEFEKAKEFLIKSIEIQSSRNNKNLLALTYFELNEWEKANNIFLNLLVENPLNCNLLLNSAKCYIKLSDINSAKKQLKKLLKIFPDMEEAREILDEVKGEK